jgi:signal peptidase I
VVVALFLLTFVLQPYLIPSESMERTLLVGDFLLVNKQVYAPAGSLDPAWLLPYREVARGDIVVFHHPSPRIWSSEWWAFPATGCASRMAASR